MIIRQIPPMAIGDPPEAPDAAILWSRLLAGGDLPDTMNGLPRKPEDAWHGMPTFLKPVPDRIFPDNQRVIPMSGDSDRAS
ncbi:MAG: hypothetical protein VX403_02465, partial [Planctomycetota bacterium]|nr:hypothetical protein [Planctomycetota bacterium]